MLPVGWLIVAVVVAIVATMWITFTLTRLDRLHARVDAAQAALDAQLVRRAAALQHAAESPVSGVPPQLQARLATVARAALAAGQDDSVRQDRENAVGRSLAELAQRPAPLDHAADEELRESAARVLIARRFYNDAVRDTRALRERRLPRLLRMAGHRDMPTFFDIDDTLPATRPDHRRPLTTEPPTTEEVQS